MYDQMSLLDIPSVISLPALESGAWPCVKLDGQMTVQSGPALALASLSARQAKALGLLTSGTCGLRSTTLSASASLQKSLESRLQAKLLNLGSTLYTQTWKPWVTPSGVCRLRQRVSARRTSEIERTGWVTPTSRNYKDTPSMVSQRDGKDRLDQLPRRAYLAGWPTPNTNNCKGACVENDSFDKRKDDGRQQNLQDIVQGLQPARLTASGQMLTGSSAGMVSGGQLSPRMSLWLMLGPFSEIWLQAAEKATLKKKGQK